MVWWLSKFPCQAGPYYEATQSFTDVRIDVFKTYSQNSLCKLESRIDQIARGNFKGLYAFVIRFDWLILHRELKCFGMD